MTITRGDLNQPSSIIRNRNIALYVITQKTCKNYAIKLWNSGPKHVQSWKSLNEIKTHTKIFAKTLPIMN